MRDQAIKPYELINDIVDYKYINYYVAEINKTAVGFDTMQKTLKFELRPYFGDPDICVHFGSRPRNFSDYKFCSTETQRESLVVTPDERKEFSTGLGQQSEFAYIAIKSTWQSSYSFYIDIQQTEYNLIQLGLPQSGTLAAKHFIIY